MLKNTDVIKGVLHVHECHQFQRVAIWNWKPTVRNRENRITLCKIGGIKKEKLILGI